MRREEISGTSLRRINFTTAFLQQAELSSTKDNHLQVFVY